MSTTTEGAEYGKVYLVGAGPGDPGLVTVKGRQLIERCDVLVYDYLTCAAIRSWVKPDCELVYVGKQPQFHALPQEEISALLVTKAREGKQVVRLKGGDPFIFGRGGEEMALLQESGIHFEIVPGVTAALAAAAYTGIPLTHREHSSSLCFLTGHENPQKQEMRVDFQKFAHVGGTLCLYMGVGQIRRIVAELRAGGLAGDTATAVVQWATTPRQRSFHCQLDTLVDTIETEGVTSPALIFVGPSAAGGPDRGWFESLPLFGKRYVVTRSRPQAGVLAGRLAELGAEVLEIPLIEMTRKADPERVADVLAELGSYEWIVFTSINGVRGFFDLYLNKWCDLRNLGPAKIACIGAGTLAEVERFHLQADLVPPTAVAEDLARALVDTGTLEHQKVLLVTGNRNRDVLARTLEEARAIVDTLEVYQTHFTDIAETPEARRFREVGADVVIFSSSSTVESMCSQPQAFQLDAQARRPRFCSFGPITSATLKDKGLPVDIEAREPTIESVVQALLEN